MSVYLDDGYQRNLYLGPAHYVAAYDGRVYVDGVTVSNPTASPRDWTMGRASPVTWSRINFASHGILWPRDEEVAFSILCLTVWARLISDAAPFSLEPRWWWRNHELTETNDFVRRVAPRMDDSSGTIVDMPYGADVGKLGASARTMVIVPARMLIAGPV